MGTFESEVLPKTELTKEDSYERFLRKQDTQIGKKVSITHKNTMKTQQMLHISNNFVLPNRCSETEVNRRKNNFIQ